MKKKILALMLCVALAAVAIVGGTLAYFTDSKEQTNTFTAGNVRITLDEAKINKGDYGEAVADETSRTSKAQNYKLFPGMTVTKDPTIKVLSTSESAYVGAKITIQGDIYGLIGVSGYDNIDITKYGLVSGGITSASTAEQRFDWNGLSMVYENNDCVIYQDANKADKTWTLYVFVKDVQEKGEKVVLFDTLTIPDFYGNEEMAKLDDTTVKVEAFATQAQGFTSCYQAMTEAFDEAFAACITDTTTP